MMCTPIEPPSTGRILFEDQLDLIRRTLSFVARRRRMDAETADDFSGFAYLRLLERDAEILRAFEGRSTFKTYLVTVIQRLYLDYQIQRYGKWRPSRRAQRLGPLAIELDRMIHREGRTLDEAARLIRERGFGAVDRAELAALARAIPNQRRRPRQERIEKAEDLPCDGGVEDRLLEREALRAARRIEKALAAALAALPAEDRLLLRLRFEEGMTVRAIAASHGFEARGLYGRYERILRGLKRSLESAGVGQDVARPLLERMGFDLNVGLRTKLATA